MHTGGRGSNGRIVEGLQRSWLSTHTGAEVGHRLIPTLIARHAPFVLGADQMAGEHRGSAETGRQPRGALACDARRSELTERNVKAKGRSPKRDRQADPTCPFGFLGPAAPQR